MAANRADGTGKTRDILAYVVLAVGIGGIIAISFAAIGFATSTDRPDVTQLVFSSVLPLLGTWVGTVLAFYFAKENLAAATESSIRLAGRVEPATPVREVMIPKAKIVGRTLGQGEDPAAVPLVELYNSMRSADVHRIPVFDASGAVLYIVHDATLATFADSIGTALSDLTETMSDLLQRPECKVAVEAIGVVGPDAVLADARSAMRAIEKCNDVFVTSGGKRSDPVLGWLTNTDLASIQ